MGKVINCGRVVLSRDGMIRAGKYEIGEWEREGVAISFHYRPSGNERQWEYVARMHDDNHFCAPTMAELRECIMEEYRDGIEIED